LWFNEVTVHTTTEKLVRYHIWMNEMGSRALGQQSVRLGKRVDKFTCCFNAKGFTPSHMRHGSMNFVKQITAIDQQHYPERLGIIMLINAPRLISVVWSVIKRWLDPITREKVKIHFFFLSANSLPLRRSQATPIPCHVYRFTLFRSKANGRQCSKGLWRPMRSPISTAVSYGDV